MYKVKFNSSCYARICADVRVCCSFRSNLSTSYWKTGQNIMLSALPINGLSHFSACFHITTTHSNTWLEKENGSIMILGNCSSEFNSSIIDWKLLSLRAVEIHFHETFCAKNANTYCSIILPLVCLVLHQLKEAPLCNAPLCSTQIYLGVAIICSRAVSQCHWDEAD